MSASSISANDLTQLKEEVLRAVLNDGSLPGTSQRLTFPDLPFALTQPVVYLVDEDIKNAISIEKINKSVQVVSEDFLHQDTAKPGKSIFFQFETTEQDRDHLLLSLHTKVFSPADQRTQNLSSMQMNFQKVGTGWRMIDGPTSLSA
ncbi:MAG: hypothetical protein H7Z13_08025 [Ferruginibacter sp.]|nr:hypothetical protein [Ferruginibacter sp.]